MRQKSILMLVALTLCYANTSCCQETTSTSATCPKKLLFHQDGHYWYKVVRCDKSGTACDETPLTVRYGYKKQAKLGCKHEDNRCKCNHPALPDKIETYLYAAKTGDYWKEFAGQINALRNDADSNTDSDVSLFRSEIPEERKIKLSDKDGYWEIVAQNMLVKVQVKLGGEIYNFFFVCIRGTFHSDGESTTVAIAAPCPEIRQDHPAHVGRVVYDLIENRYVLQCDARLLGEIRMIEFDQIFGLSSPK